MTFSSHRRLVMSSLRTLAPLFRPLSTYGRRRATPTTLGITDDDRRPRDGQSKQPISFYWADLDATSGWDVAGEVVE